MFRVFSPWIRGCFIRAFGPGWFVTGLITPGKAETSTLTASGLASGLLQAIADGLAQTPGGWEGYEYLRQCKIVEGSEAGKKVGGEGFWLVPWTPGEDGCGGGIEGPVRGEKYADSGCLRVGAQH